MTSRFILVFIFSLFLSPLFSQDSRETVIDNINNWYQEQNDLYSLKLDPTQTNAYVTRYHPERSDERNDLIKIEYQGMKIILKFDQPLDAISTHKDSLMKHFDYLSINDIYVEIPTKNWDIHPKTPSSSLRGKGIKFVEGGGFISCEINWSIFSVVAYKSSEYCDNERSMMDSSLPESCYASVDRDLKLEIIIPKIPLNGL